MTLLESAGHVGIPLSRISGSTGILEVGLLMVPGFFDAWGWDGFTVGRCGVGYGGGLYELFISRSILGDLGTIVTNHFTKWDGYSKVGRVKVLYSKIS